MRITWRTEWPNWAVIGGMFVAAALFWSSAPESFPIHWNWQGQVDRYAGKPEGLLLMPAITLGLYLLLIFVPRIDPLRANYELFSGVYATLRLVFTVSFALIYAVTLLSAQGYPIDTALMMPLVVGGMLIVVGNFMGKTRPNWFVGIKTPWTLTSRKSWTRTHRLGGWLLILTGLLIAFSGIVRTQWAFALTAAWFPVFLVWIFAYSYLVWRTDPDRTGFRLRNGDRG